MPWYRGTKPVVVAVSVGGAAVLIIGRGLLKGVGGPFQKRGLKKSILPSIDVSYRK